MNTAFALPFVGFFLVNHAISCCATAATQNQEAEHRTPFQFTSATNDETLQLFFDKLIPLQMEKYHVPGATIVVVKNGVITFAKGYGFSRLDERVAVDPAKSLFRIASITKLFTWTAVMQLVEKGKLDLGADVNTYLTEFQLPATYPEPITLAHLMAHAAGFEDRGLIGSLARTPDKVIPLAKYLAENMPARVRPPGCVSASSNSGGVLAGHIVYIVSGSPFAR